MSSNSEYLHVGPEARRPPRMPPPTTHPPFEPVEAPSKSPSHLIAGVIWVATLMAAAILGVRQEAPATAASSTPEKPAATSEPDKSAVASETAKAAPAARDASALQSQLDRLSSEFKELQAKLEGLPKPETAFKPMEDKVDELAKSVAVVVPLAKKVDQLDERISGVNDAVKSIKAEISGLSDQLKALAVKPAEASVAKVDDEPKSAEGSAPALSEGVDLFKAGKYKEAGEVFKRMEAANPNDARVYYFEALINGLTTGQWQADTLKIATKGASLEKLGATRPADVDATFSEFPANLKRWVAYFRTQAK